MSGSEGATGWNKCVCLVRILLQWLRYACLRLML